MKHPILRPLLLVLIALCALACGSLWESDDGDVAFFFTFDVRPSPRFTNLKGYHHAFRDSGRTYLRFDGTCRDVEILLGKHYSSFKTQTIEELAGTDAMIINPGHSWWTPPSASTTLVHYSEDFHPTFHTGSAYYICDTTTGVVYFYWRGVS